MGNQACDLDSIVSALTFSYLQSLSHPTKFYPLVPILRREVKLRTEVTFLFKKVGIDLTDLICLEDFQAATFSNPLSFTLVDHNSLSSTFSSYDSNVVEIIDHHEDMKADFPNLKKKCIQVEIILSAQNGQ
eukprot:TRINITY_DN7580_c0_g1_i6.p1 TRINITY_DN7580_c0_g1~~TRINITY_DN7580_c0_g1_i6.p1  ORF type:complete len:131 (-),score=23.10 TRINITY_DN7580_c0_g1_i6:312-704(-)